MKEISKSRIGKYALLRHKKHRDREGLFLVQGEKAVRDAIPHFEVVELIEDPEAIKKISTLENLPGVIAVCRIPEKKQTLKVDRNRFVLVLDGVQDPGNLGTIIRTSHWFGVRQIFCSLDTVDLYNPKVVMSTMGSIARVDVTYCDLKELIDANPNLPVYGLLLEGEDIFKAEGLTPGLIVMGSEGHGPSHEVMERITRGLTIPAADSGNRPDSLNVAVATAITLAQMIK